MKNIGREYLETIKEDFEKYKRIADAAMEQLNGDEIHYRGGEDSNSISILVQHISGNLASRFTDFLASDGEKEWRKRDTEFEEQNSSKEKLLERWEASWKILFEQLDKLGADDLTKQVKIRNEPHSVIKALNRQAVHYAYHVGQIVFIAKEIKKGNWKTLSVAKGKSQEFNRKMFSQGRDN